MLAATMRCPGDPSCPSRLRALTGALRPPFLLLTPVCVALGAASAAWAGHTVVPAALALVLAGALAAHASVNLFNEWFDFRSGLDAITSRTPFSGGSGALPAQPAAASWVLAAALATLAISAAVGLWLLATRGPALLPLGLVGLALVAGYTPWITRHPLACLLAPGLGFGPLMVGGTQVALSGVHEPLAYVASLVPLALVSGLLLLNQFPDVDADRRVGRRHLPLLRGRPWAARLLGALLAGAFGALALGVLAGVLPRGAVLGLAMAPLAWSVARGARRHADDLPALVPVMGRNVVLVLLTPVLMALGGLWKG
jgi:1,4-dihydroxy-2-naphthoate octaprenyltransferase